MGKVSMEQIESMLKKGFSQSEIARIYDVSRQAISYRIHYPKSKRFEILRKRAGIVIMRELGFKYREIAECFGTTVSGASVTVRKHRKGEYK